MEEAQPRVLIVDDDPNILGVLRVLLAREPYQVLTAQGADAALQVLESEPVQVVLCDARMPGTSGVHLLRSLRERYPDVTRMMLTGSSDVETAAAAVNEGSVFRFLTKPPEAQMLRQAILEGLEHAEKKRKESLLFRISMEQQTLLRELYANGGPKSVEPPRASPPSLPDAITSLLSPRELDVVLGLVREGDADSIARKLSVSPHTVRTHLKSVFRKLEVHSQAALLSRLYALGLRTE